MRYTKSLLQFAAGFSCKPLQHSKLRCCSFRASSGHPVHPGAHFRTSCHSGALIRSGLNLRRSSVGPVVHIDSELDLIDLDFGVDVVHVQVGCDDVGLA